jgi:hypothetical protein
MSEGPLAINSLPLITSMGTGESATERGAAREPTTTITSASSFLFSSSAAITGSATQVIPIATTKFFIINFLDNFLSSGKSYNYILSYVCT